jgi:uncharacterized membrane-anchored protein YhcB (DUF1043 family)
MEWYRWMFLAFAIVFGIVTAVFVIRLFIKAEAEAKAHKEAQRAKFEQAQREQEQGSDE